MRATAARDIPAPSAICRSVSPWETVANARSTARPCANSGAWTLSSNTPLPSDQPLSAE